MIARPKKPAVPVERYATVRDEIAGLLAREALTAREISEQVGIREGDVLEHLEHLKLRYRGALVMEAPACLACGFSFRKRERVKGPGRCPVCKSEHISQPHFSLKFGAAPRGLER